MKTLGNQKQTVLDHLRRNGHITPLEAFMNYNIMRLAAVVFDLKADGVPIVTVMKYQLDNDGKVAKRWAEYRLA